MLTRNEVAQLDLKTINRVHMIGISSPFSSFCATKLLDMGKTVTASEHSQDNEQAKKWIEKGILYPGDHNEKYISSDIDLVIFPNGIIPGNPECEKAERLGLKTISVGQLLGIISREFKTIAIAGTHGKTTTTALVIWLLYKNFGLPNFIVGDAKDKIAQLNLNWNYNAQSEYLVLEACEYKRQFLDRAPHPFISVITHIDLDHTDYYKSQAEYNLAFEEFLSNTQQAIIIDNEGTNEKNVVANITNWNNNEKHKIISTGLLKQYFPEINSPLFGNHNYENLIRAAGVGIALNLNSEKITSSFEDFPGISSRFEYKGKTINDNPVYKDFAHNPAKLRSCIQGAKEAYPDKQLIFVYQPHNFERTFSFKKEIIDALKEADVIVIPNIYSVRESEDEKKLITAESFVNSIKLKYPNKKVYLTNDVSPFSETMKIVNQCETSSENCIVLASAGDLEKILPSLVVNP